MSSEWWRQTDRDLDWRVLVPDPQHPTLTVLPTEHDPEESAQRAWLKFAAGIEEALMVPGLPVEDEASLRRCYQLARQRAGLRRLAPVQSER